MTKFKTLMKSLFSNLLTFKLDVYFSISFIAIFISTLGIIFEFLHFCINNIFDNQ